jgi:hypothetical protein
MTAVIGSASKFRALLQKHVPAGLKSVTDPRETARQFIEELRKKHTFQHESGKPVDTTIGVILTNTRVKFVIPGSPGQSPVEGKR